MNFGSKNMMLAMAKDIHVNVHAPSESESKFDMLVFNISKSYLDMARKIATTSGCKTITKEHVKLMQEMAVAMRTVGKSTTNRKMKGGAETVLPSEYFGGVSSRYFAASQVQGLEHSALGANVSRSALPSSEFGLRGGGCPCKHGGGGKNNLTGGAETVLASEYFGNDSGRYFAHNVVSGAEHTTSGSDTVARQALFQSGGGFLSTLRDRLSPVRLPNDVFESVLQEYKSRNVGAGDMRISSDARAMLRNYIGGSVADAVAKGHSKFKTSSLTPRCIEYATKSFVMFP
jgi:hypothetical protein